MIASGGGMLRTLMNYSSLCQIVCLVLCSILMQGILHGSATHWVALQNEFASVCVHKTGFLQLCKNTLVHPTNLLSPLGMNG